MSHLEFESKINQLDTELKKLKNSRECKDNDLVSVNVASPDVAKLLDQLSKRVNGLENENSNLKKDILELNSLNSETQTKFERVGKQLEKLDDKKCDLKYVDKRLESKVEQKELNVKINKSDFDQSIENIIEQMERLSHNMSVLENQWNENTNSMMKQIDSKMGKSDMEPFKAQLDSRLKSLKKLLEVTRDEESNINSHDNSNHFGKPQISGVPVDYESGMFRNQPVASIPTAGHLPHMDTIRPYTTFDLHTIRHQANFNKTALDQREYMHNKKTRELDYRRHVAESMNYAFNAYEQTSQSSKFVPISGGASVPNGYPLSKIGRSCGGGFTMMSPHRRYKHLGGELFQSETMDDPRREIQDQYNNPQEEVELYGHDGHVYKGRSLHD